MKSTLGKFDCRVSKMCSGDMPFTPSVEIIPDDWGPSEEGTPCATPDLKTSEEIDTYVEMLINELFVVAAKAKGLLASAKAETRAIISANKCLAPFRHLFEIG